MKHIKFVFALLLFAATITACKKDKEIAPNAPEISGFELGTSNSKTANPGSDLHIEAQIVAQGTIASVELEIHPESGTGWNVKTTFTEGFTGLKNAEFHKHIDVPADAALGDYHFHLKVKDQNGQETAIESELKVVAKTTLASAPNKNH